MAMQATTWLNQLEPPVLDSLRLLNGDKIPVDVKNHIANWIQAYLIKAPGYYNDQSATHDMYEDAVIFLNKLIDKLRHTGALCSKDINTELNGLACILQDLFSGNPVKLYQELINCLQRNPYHCINIDAFDGSKMFRELEQLKVMMIQHEHVYGNMILEHGYLAHETDVLQNIKAMLHTDQTKEECMCRQLQLINQQKKVKGHLRTFSDMEFAVVSGFGKMIQKTAELQDKILNKYIEQWKLNQRLAGIGAMANLESDLNTIQLWCESLAEIILRLKEQIMQTSNLISQGYVDLMAQAMKNVDNLLQTLIYKSFIVEHQPSQILRMHARFVTSVRLLTGATLCNRFKPLHVSVSIITIDQARQVHYVNEATTSAAGEISNNVTVMQYLEPVKRVSAIFPQMCIDKVSRMQIKSTNKKQNNKCVLDEKFVLLYQTTIATEQGDLVLPVRTVSCPVVITVHVSQEEKSYATIIWENVFAKNIHSSFDVPELVRWNWLAEILSMKFSVFSGLHRLSPEHLHFLCEKALGSADIPFPTPNGLIITWSQFCKNELLPGRGYTFWGWFYQMMKLTRDHLQKLWCNSRLHWFITKSKAEQYLSDCETGTFLMRFSDSVPGGITVTFVREDNLGQRQILHIEPLTAKDLAVRSLTDRLLDIEVLTHLYPNVPKHQVFQRRPVQYAGVSRQTNYVKTELRATLIFSPVDQPKNEACTNEQVPSKREYTFSNNDSMSFFELETITVLTEKV
ncbi:signal transducer and transcription activator-like [Anopheles maculipalpis]|uniref:signal transducer and transcription activator-like n=1 Tax=Anopheles maculipalpis TaxID=1496333 RepID=UPI0021593EC7|nr:signal transducer and transcription activator-like [Anopheles maculipalpis]